MKNNTENRPTAFNADKVIKQIEARYRNVKSYEDTVWNQALDIAILIIQKEQKGTIKED